MSRLDELWEAIEKAGDTDDCIEFECGADKAGYPCVRFHGIKRNAGMVVLERKLGRYLRNGYETCHTCNNKKCINARHLYEGTHQDNVKDTVKSGTHPWLKKNRRRKNATTLHG